MTNTNYTTERNYTNTTDTNRVNISKKTFASIKMAQADMKAILTLGKNLNEENAYKTAQAMAAIAEKYMADFKDVDPAWTPETALRTKERWYA